MKQNESYVFKLGLFAPLYPMKLHDETLFGFQNNE